MLNCMGPAQQPKVLTPLWTPGAGVRPWLVSTLPMPASSCQVSAGQVWAAWIYRPRYPDGISASAKALALATAGTELALGLERGVARVWWITRLTAVPTLARGKPGEARSVTCAITRTLVVLPLTRCCWSAWTRSGEIRSRLAYQATAALCGSLAGRARATDAREVSREAPAVLAALVALPPAAGLATAAGTAEFSGRGGVAGPSAWA